MGSRMSSAAVLLVCMIRNAQNIPTEEGLQSKGSSHVDTHISDGEEMGTLGCKQVWHVYSRSPCHKEG